MYCVVAWEVPVLSQRHEEINNNLREALGGYQWVNPLHNCYIVTIASAKEHEQILSALQTRGFAHKAAGVAVKIIVSPPYPTGYFDGLLPNDLWAKVNERTKA